MRSQSPVEGERVDNPRVIKRDLALTLLSVTMLLAACGQSADQGHAAPNTAVERAENGDLPEFAPIEIERVQPSDVGLEYAVGELILALEEGTAEPLDRAATIASEFDGQVVSADPDLRIFQLRFGDEELEELRELRDQIAQSPDVEFVGVHYLGRFDQDW